MKARLQHERLIDFHEERRQYKIYERFAELLAEKGITAYRVAKDTGLSSTLFSEWKSGKSNPKADKLLKLAKYFGVTIEYFLSSEGKVTA